MLQDLAFGKLENEFFNVQPEDSAAAVCFFDGAVLIRREADDTLTLPTVAQLREWAQSEDSQSFQYLFRLQGQAVFLWLGEKLNRIPPGYGYEPVRPLRQLVSKEICFGIMTAWHLFRWYKSNRYCGCCATPTIHDDKERMLRCPQCGNMIFPKIAPAVIIAVTDGDRLLLSKYAGRSYTRYALLAGYTEIGETLEQTVRREVMEEVGLRVRNIRYYKSQPWGVDSTVLMGFFCDLDGADTIRLDTTELALAQWHHRDRLPAHDDGISLTREMIRVFEEGREPHGIT